MHYLDFQNTATLYPYLIQENIEGIFDDVHTVFVHYDYSKYSKLNWFEDYIGSNYNDKPILSKNS